VLRAGVDGALLTQARVTGAFAGLATVLLAARPGVLRANLRQVAYLVAFALLGLNGVQLFYFLPIERLPIRIAVLIEYVAPVLVALYAALVLRHRLGRGLGVRGERRVLGGRRAAVVVPVAPARRPGRRRRRARRGDAAQGVLVAWVVVLGTLIPFALLLSGAPRAPRRARHAALDVGAAGRRDRRLGVALGAPERHPGGGAALVLAGILIAEARQPLHIPD
jgi:hypothetical protein